MNYHYSYKSSLQELPYSGNNILSVHGQFNNLNDVERPSKRYLDRLTSLHDLDLFSLNLDSTRHPERNLMQPIRCKYFSPHSFHQHKTTFSDKSSFSLLHNNVQSLKLHIDDFQVHLLNELQLQFSIIGITETKIKNTDIPIDFDPSIPNYEFEYIPTPLSFGGIGMYIDKSLDYTVIERTSNEAFQALWTTIHFSDKSDFICGVIYRQHNSPEVPQLDIKAIQQCLECVFQCQSTF